MIPQIHCTRNYSLFKECNWNRDVSSKHVMNLMSGIKKNNQLDVNPIVVNSQMEVIDGQHRLAAAKNLGVPIYYIKKDFNPENPYVLTSNLYQNQCRMTDAISYYSEYHGDKNYEFLKEAKIKTGLETGACLSLLGNCVNQGYGIKMYEGILQFNHNELELNEYIERYRELKEILMPTDNKTIIALIKTIPFCKALYKFFQLDPDWKHFIKRLSRDWKDMATFFKTGQEYVEKFKKIYGKRCSKNKID